MRVWFRAFGGVRGRGGRRATCGRQGLSSTPHRSRQVEFPPLRRCSASSSPSAALTHRLCRRCARSTSALAAPADDPQRSEAQLCLRLPRQHPTWPDPCHARSQWWPRAASHWLRPFSSEVTAFFLPTFSPGLPLRSSSRYLQALSLGDSSDAAPCSLCCAPPTGQPSGCPCWPCVLGCAPGRATPLSSPRRRPLFRSAKLLDMVLPS